jgi:hypothetical protein
MIIIGLPQVLKICVNTRENYIYYAEIIMIINLTDTTKYTVEYQLALLKRPEEIAILIYCNPKFDR